MNFGPSFPFELAAAGLFGLPFSWSENGINFGDITHLDGSVTANEAMTPELRAAVYAVVAAHDPDASAPVDVPQVVSRFQGREAMHQTPHGDGTLFDAAEAVLAHTDTPAMYRRAWDDLQEFRRDSEMLAAIAGMLGLAGAQIDALFILAASINA